MNPLPDKKTSLAAAERSPRLRRRARWRDRARGRLSHGILRRRLFEAVAVSLASGAAGAFVALAAGSEGGRAAALAIGISILVFLVIAPALLMTLDVVSDFVRLSSVDAALLGGLAWHPDLSVVGIEMPPIVTEGDPYQRVAVTLEYKPLVTSYRGTLRAKARLIASPAVVSFARDQPGFAWDDLSFELSPDAPRQTITFCVQRDAAALDCLAGADAQRALATDGAIASALQLHVTSDWDLRTVPGTPLSRTAKLQLGLLHLHLLARTEWVHRMIRAGFMTVLPNGLAFNPVITSERAYGVGTNVVIGGRRWHDALARNEPEARLLLDVGARLLALQVVTEPDPDILEYQEAQTVLDPAASAPQTPATSNAVPSERQPARAEEFAKSVARAIAEDVDYEPLRKELATATRNAFSEMRRSGEFNAPVPTTDHRPHSYEVRVQDTGRSVSRLERRTPELSLIGLAEEADSRHLLVATVPTPRVGPVLPPVRALEDAIEQTGAELIAHEQIADYFPACRSVHEPGAPALATVIAQPAAEHTSSGGTSDSPVAGTVEPLAVMNCDEIDSALEEIHAVLLRSRVVTTGFYIQPQPVIKHHWLDLRACSDAIGASGLSQLARSVVMSSVRTIARAHRSSALRIYNCCAPDGDTSDHRFGPLRDLVESDVTGVRYEASTRRWVGVTDGEGDAFVVSALSNDQRAFGELLNTVARRDRPAAFVPFFGPIEPTDETLAGLAGSATVHVLPLLVWDASGAYVPSTRASRYQGLWTVLRRHEAAGGEG